MSDKLNGENNNEEVFCDYDEVEDIDEKGVLIYNKKNLVVEFIIKILNNNIEIKNNFINYIENNENIDKINNELNIELNKKLVNIYDERIIEFDYLKYKNYKNDMMYFELNFIVDENKFEKNEEELFNECIYIIKNYLVNLEILNNLEDEDELYIFYKSEECNKKDKDVLNKKEDVLEKEKKFKCCLII